MSINFPTSLDSLTNPLSTDYLNSPSHAAQHANVNDIVEALEAKVGIDASAVTTSHDYKLSEVTSSDKAVGKTATQTLSNKTLASPIITGAWDGWISIGACTYEGADAPTFTFSIAADVTAIINVGARIKLTQTTAKYFIVTAVGAYSGGKTIITVYGGTDYTLANEAITLPFYSPVKAPFGFPQDPLKWSVTTTGISYSQASPTQNQWYNPASYYCPIGAWRIQIEGGIYGDRGTSGVAEVYGGLGTANNNTGLIHINLAAWLINGGIHSEFSRETFVNLAAKTLYYLNFRTTQTEMGTIALGNTNSVTIRMICAYL